MNLIDSGDGKSLNKVNTRDFFVQLQLDEILDGNLCKNRKQIFQMN